MCFNKIIAAYKLFSQRKLYSIDPLRNYFLSLIKLHNTIFICFSISYQVILCSTDLVGMRFAIQVDICSIHHSPSSLGSNKPCSSPRSINKEKGMPTLGWSVRQSIGENGLNTQKYFDILKTASWSLAPISTLHLYEYTHKTSRMYYYSHFIH